MSAISDRNSQSTCHVEAGYSITLVHGSPECAQHLCRFHCAIIHVLCHKMWLWLVVGTVQQCTCCLAELGCTPATTQFKQNHNICVEYIRFSKKIQKSKYRKHMACFHVFVVNSNWTNALHSVYIRNYR